RRCSSRASSWPPRTCGGPCLVSLPRSQVRLTVVRIIHEPAEREAGRGPPARGGGGPPPPAPPPPTPPPPPRPRAPRARPPAAAPARPDPTSGTREQSRLALHVGVQVWRGHRPIDIAERPLVLRLARRLHQPRHRHAVERGGKADALDARCGQLRHR